MNVLDSRTGKSPGSRGGLEVEIEQMTPMPLQGAFRCAPGELLALVGPSGAGKSSMLRVLAGLMRPERGCVVVDGELWCDTARGIFQPAQQRHVGLVFQDYALMPHLNALDNVALSLLSMPRDARRVQAREWLDHVHLSREQQARRPAALSGGQQQRVAVARALARQPRLLLLDEPFSAVDQMNRRGLYQLLAELRQDLSIPIVLVTHDLNEARLLADRLVVMDAGHVLQQGAPEQIHRAPRNARVADLVGIQNRFRGEWLGPAATPGFGRIRWLHEGADPTAAPVLEVRDKGRLPAGQAIHWVIPGDGVSLTDAPASAPDTFSAQVVQARHLGEISLISLVIAEVGGATLVLTLAGGPGRRLQLGERTTVQLDREQIHVMPLRQR